ncbi:flagellar transcriptional regulator FlhD [Pistricoccus aurantiacus]|uniref:Flagellar transcriptional regulator FlhD n=1 Tax=Pistricoccus aurantiacus TaxID=1883414 RepID=A0A5B8SZN6_9GAMM|nr:flagellar transcriptional regulator FlhD [Pistricoccus aurantiacus]QEA40268.1 flagellar transcriptional regulator FlhD [Pistricoccus aurantiacus]
MNDTVLNEIQELNLSYLLLVQRLLREDRATAMFRLKIDAEMADLLQSLGSKQLSQLSRTNQLLCQPGFEGAAQLRALTQHRREQGLSPTHTALLMASASFSGLNAAQGV